MSLDAHFNAAAVEAIKSLGATATYTQGGSSDNFRVWIDHALEIVDPESGGASYVTAALIAKSDFSFASVKPGDTILQNSRTWQVTRQLEDDGYLLTLEVM